MAHRLNTNKQFMIGNGILAFAVIFVVVIFVYMSMRLQQRKEGERKFIETYTITLTKGFAGDSLTWLLFYLIFQKLQEVFYERNFSKAFFRYKSIQFLSNHSHFL